MMRTQNLSRSLIKISSRKVNVNRYLRCLKKPESENEQFVELEKRNLKKDNISIRSEPYFLKF